MELVFFLDFFEIFIDGFCKKNESISREFNFFSNMNDKNSELFLCFWLKDFVFSSACGNDYYTNET
jgi:hypothetical protein